MTSFSTQLTTLCIAVVVFTVAQAQWNNLPETPPPTCFTPQGEQGQCVLVKDCAGLLAFFLRSINAESRRYVEQFRCNDRSERYIKVCCAENGLEGPTTTSRPTPRQTTRRATRPTTQPTTRPTPRSFTRPTSRPTPNPNEGRSQPMTASLANHRNINLLPLDICGLSFVKRIYNGNVTGLDEFPWAAMLEYERDGQRAFQCGGSLISQRYVLTAAHCSSKGTIGRWRPVGVRLGEYNTLTNPDCEPGIKPNDQPVCADPPINFGIEREIVHPQYRSDSKNQYNDIALFRLDSDAPITDNIVPICIPTDETLARKMYTGNTLTATGWGRTATENRSPVKMKAILPIVSNEDCAVTYKNSGRTITSSQICAGGQEGVDVCTGDSGAPLMSYEVLNSQPRFHVTGIVSYGSGACHWGQAGVYTRVATYSRWILDQLKP